MYRICLLTALLLISVPLAADTKTEIRTALDYYVQVWNENDIDAIASYYHSDFVLVTDAGVVSRQRVLDDLARIGQRGGDRGQFSHSNVEVRPLGEKHAMAYGKAVLSFEDGSSIESWFTTLYENTPFGWKAILTRN